MSLQHVVLFSFPTELGEADWAEMQRQVRAWPTAIGGMTSLRFGSPTSAERTRGYQYLLFTEFPDGAALRAYQQHPVHQDFLAWIREHDCTPLAFDYDLDDATVIVGG